MRHFKCKLFSSGLLLAASALLVCAQGIKERQPAQEPPSAPMPEAGHNRARDLYYLADKAGEIRYTGLRVKLYQADAQCNFKMVSPLQTFHTGEALRFSVESNVSGFVYIVQRGSSGQTTLLFPHPEISSGANQLPRGVELMIPGKEWFRFDQTAGVETVSIIFTRRKLDLLPYLIPSAAIGPATSPAGPPAGSAAAVLDILQGRTKARDLVYEPAAAPAPAMANSGVLYNGVYAVNTAKTGNEFCVLELKLKNSGHQPAR